MRKQSKLAPEWWDYTTLDKEILDDAAVLDEKDILEVKDGKVGVVDQELCGGDGTCALICPVDAIRLVKREVE